MSNYPKAIGPYSAYREVNGLLEATDLNTIKKSTIEALSEKTLLNTPTYWLSPALVALCAWFTNNKDLASRAVNEALKRVVFSGNEDNVSHCVPLYLKYVDWYWRIVEKSSICVIVEFAGACVISICVNTNDWLSNDQYNPLDVV